MKNIFEKFADELLKLPEEDVIFTTFPDGNAFGFRYRNNYSGLMASRPHWKRPKQGLFDVLVLTGNRYPLNGEVGVTHYLAFNDLLAHSNLPNCEKIWEGQDPLIVGQNNDERQALLALALLMFEQELNWGDQNYQKFTAFPPSKGSRPRDMIMGFLHIIFTQNNVDAIQSWKPSIYNKKTPDFGGKYADFPVELKKAHFNQYAENRTVRPLMQGDYLTRFMLVADRFDNNSN
ncbi:hypothetical protein [Bacillus seohaeanensis]|uniref:Uncharacterized protein n=1 Tax=Bacillus seohaeanensis TaxID=284580 RepID=A0ABW5RUF4_9BACI